MNPLCLCTDEQPSVAHFEVRILCQITKVRLHLMNLFYAINLIWYVYIMYMCQILLGRSIGPQVKLTLQKYGISPPEREKGYYVTNVSLDKRE